ncbi:MAG: cell division ATP-binding protein FtsE [Ruminococcus sp.]|nr:cell division ATP-binding protein FtsE [Ruminococcus sp.]
MIDFENVSKTYPNGTNALHNVSLHIDKAEFVFIVGASGAGKSTFLKLIMREEVPTSGEITINGNRLSKLKKRHVPYLRRHMGIVFQDFRLIDKMNVFDNVAFAMRAVGENTATVKKRVPYVLDLVGLKDKMKCKPSELSGGEQQRVSLARALVNNPEIIVADEPTGNIDPELSHEIIELLTRINSMGTTVLVVTHEHELVREFNQRVITIDKGEVISDSATMQRVYAETESFDGESLIDIAAPAEQSAEEPATEAPVAEAPAAENVLPVTPKVSAEPETEELTDSVAAKPEEIAAVEALPAAEEPQEVLTDAVAATPEEIAAIEALIQAEQPLEEKPKEVPPSAEELIADNNFDEITFDSAYYAPEDFETEALPVVSKDAEPQTAAADRE